MTEPRRLAKDTASDSPEVLRRESRSESGRPRRPIKERLFGLTNSEGNHGEDVT